MLVRNACATEFFKLRIGNIEIHVEHFRRAMELDLGYLDRFFGRCSERVEYMRPLDKRIMEARRDLPDGSFRDIAFDEEGLR